MNNTRPGTRPRILHLAIHKDVNREFTPTELKKWNKLKNEELSILQAMSREVERREKELDADRYSL